MIVEPTPENIQLAADLLRAGHLIGLPTETVYGLGADARNPVAVSKIFHAKGRPADHPLIVHLAETAQLTLWARDIPAEAYRLAEAFWPGPMTLILKRATDVCDAVTGGQDTIGLRIPAHPVALALLGASRTGIAAPSANRFGRISPTTAHHVAEELGKHVSLVLDGGPCQVGIESTIIDLSRGIIDILRPGAITPDDITQALAKTALPEAPLPSGQISLITTPLSDKPEPTDSGPAPRVSGALAAHYAPRTPLRLIPSDQLQAEAEKLIAAGKRIAILTHTVRCIGSAAPCQHTLPAHPDGYARQLYATLRRLDTLHADCLLVETIPATSAWRAIADRLGRAAVGSGTPDHST